MDARSVLFAEHKIGALLGLPRTLGGHATECRVSLHAFAGCSSTTCTKLCRCRCPCLLYRSSVFRTSDVRAIRETNTSGGMLMAAARLFYLYYLWELSKLIKAAAGGATAGAGAPYLPYAKRKASTEPTLGGHTIRGMITCGVAS